MSPRGQLTGVQVEIMEALWDHADGATVAEIWEAIRGERDVARTTVLTLVSRLYERGWLTRRRRGRSWVYFPGVPREEALDQLAGDFVDEYFNGSLSDFMKSLLGSRRIRSAELQRAQRMLDEAKTNPKKKKRSS